MKREVVQDFLNLPGIAGVALMDGRSRPYFYGVDESLNFQQKESLAQGIQQVVETTPTGFEFFEFQFTGHQVYIYKLDHGIILLVLTDSHLILADYAKAIDQLKVELQEDAANAIATFRLLAGNVTLSSQSFSQLRSEATSTRSTTIPGSLTAASTNSAPAPAPAPPPPAATAPSAAPAPTNLAKPPPSPPAATVKEFISALNHLSQFTTQYLGTTVVTNYWKSSRPDNDWLNQFQVDRSAQFSFSGSSPAGNSQVLSPEQHQWIQDWTEAFVQRCSKVIRDFPNLVRKRALDDHQKALLLTDPS